MRIPANIPVSILSFFLLAIQYTVYRLQFKIGPRLKFLKLSASDEGYSYFKTDQIQKISKNFECCPICFSDLDEEIDIEIDLEKLEHASLMVNYLGIDLLKFN